MKTNQFFFAAFCLFFLGNLNISQAQKINFWKGGTPGQEASWSCAKNWSANRVPDAFQDVIIPDVSTGSGVYPFIKVDGMEVNSLALESNAKLLIGTKGSLNVLNGLEQYGSSELETKGLLVVPSNNFAGTNLIDAMALAEKN